MSPLLTSGASVIAPTTVNYSECWDATVMPVLTRGFEPLNVGSTSVHSGSLARCLGIGLLDRRFDIFGNEAGVYRFARTPR